MGAIQTFQKLNVCKEFKCSMVQWYFARMALKSPIVNLITASQSCFPKNSTSIPSPKFPSKVFQEAEKIMIIYLLFLGDINFRGILVKLSLVEFVQVSSTNNYTKYSRILSWLLHLVVKCDANCLEIK